MDKWHRERIKASNKDKILRVISQNSNINYNDIISLLNKEHERNNLPWKTIKSMCNEIVEENISFPLIDVHIWGGTKEDTINPNSVLEKFLEDGGYTGQLNALIADDAKSSKIMMRTYYITIITLVLTILLFILDKIIG